MTLTPAKKLYLFLSIFILVLHLVVASIAKPSFPLTIFGDAVPCVLLVFAVLVFAGNVRKSQGTLALFWKLFAAGLFTMLLSESYWFYFDSMRRHGNPSPVLGDCLFLLAHVFFLFALALRPHAAAAGHDLRIRRLDFALLTLWWFALYGYFALPWQILVRDFSKYNPAYYVLALIQHFILALALIFLAVRKKGSWRFFYLQFLGAIVLIGLGNLLLSVYIDRGLYYAGSFFDTPFFLSLVAFTFSGCYGSRLEPSEEVNADRELTQSVWTARIAMLAVLSLPLVALFGFYESNVPTSVAAFRLRLVFGAMFFLGALAFWKLNLLARELAHLVNLTHASIENLKSVQSRITQSQKFAALGRLAAGATHEISNPLTAILGYSELLADIPALSADDRENAQVIQQQVHRAQSAVNSLRNSLRGPAEPHPIAAQNPQM
ncbi:MAG TPA: histidine kinase dimerization/phospho-acceptor domain-containing protein [Candidatus Acidoferrum sp.]|nr:histidine kinase dimerization/phospho-acceptor domain-containing protein [Candidatus Acidoferrum sp.]